MDRTPIDIFLERKAKPYKNEWKLHIQKVDPCAFCGGPGGTKDHIKPKHKGGSSKVENLTGACAFCNSIKSSRELLQYLLWRLDNPRKCKPKR